MSKSKVIYIFFFWCFSFVVTCRWRKRLAGWIHGKTRRILFWSNEIVISPLLDFWAFRQNYSCAWFCAFTQMGRNLISRILLRVFPTEPNKQTKILIRNQHNKVHSLELLDEFRKCAGLIASLASVYMTPNDRSNARHHLVPRRFELLQSM